MNTIVNKINYYYYCYCYCYCCCCCCCYYYYYYTPFNGFFSRTTRVSRYQKSKTSLDLNEARDDEVLRCSGIRCTKQSAPRSRQITTPTPRHLTFYMPDALPDAQPTVSKHRRHKITVIKYE